MSETTTWIGGFGWSIYTSIPMIVLGVIVLIYIWWDRRKNEFERTKKNR